MSFLDWEGIKTTIRDVCTTNSNRKKIIFSFFCIFWVQVLCDVTRRAGFTASPFTILPVWKWFAFNIKRRSQCSGCLCRISSRNYAKLLITISFTCAWLPAVRSLDLERGADEVGETCGKNEMEASVSTRNLWPERESWRKTMLESPAGRAWTSCLSVSFPEPKSLEFCNVESEHRICDDISKGQRLHWRT